MPEARKLDAGKPRMDLIPPEELLELGGTFAVGAKKYGDDNWREGDGLEWKRLFASTQRHLNLWWAGEDYDQEDGHPHLMAAAFGCFALRWLSKHRRHMDRRVVDGTEADRIFPRYRLPTREEHASAMDEPARRQLADQGDHGEREAPESPPAEPDPEVQARLSVSILLAQRGVQSLERYVGHKEGCQGFRGDPKQPCTCGLDNLVRELRKA